MNLTHRVKRRKVDTKYWEFVTHGDLTTRLEVLSRRFTESEAAAYVAERSAACPGYEYAARLIDRPKSPGRRKT